MEQNNTNLEGISSREARSVSASYYGTCMARCGEVGQVTNTACSESCVQRSMDVSNAAAGTVGMAAVLANRSGANVAAAVIRDNAVAGCVNRIDQN